MLQKTNRAAPPVKNDVLRHAREHVWNDDRQALQRAWGSVLRLFRLTGRRFDNCNSGRPARRPAH